MQNWRHLFKPGSETRWMKSNSCVSYANVSSWVMKYVVLPLNVALCWPDCHSTFSFKLVTNLEAVKRQLFARFSVFIWVSHPDRVFRGKQPPCEYDLLNSRLKQQEQRTHPLHSDRLCGNFLDSEWWIGLGLTTSVDSRWNKQ